MRRGGLLPLALAALLQRAAATDTESSTPRDAPASLDLSSPFLPASLPAGDPSAFALPVFLEEPEDTYVVKGRAAVLRCRVAHALSLHVQCNDEVQEAAVVTEGEHESAKGGIKYTEARMEVTRDQVEEFFGDYHCACVAYSGQGRASSRLARVAIAYIKKEFEVPPYSAQELVGRQVELRCHAPRGKPEPHLSWLKDGRQVAEDEDGIIVTTEGHLIIVSARLKDSGNFTCVADNLAGSRRSPPAEIVIYESAGGWSSWSSWSKCPASCGRSLDRPVRRRSRVCQGGRPNSCMGQAIQKRPCECMVASEELLTPWSSWSSCAEDCTRTRKRRCFSSSCSGPKSDSSRCAGNLCVPREWAEPASSSAPSTSDVALYVGLSLAVLVFLVVLLIALSLLRRRRLPGGYSLAEQYRAQGAGKKVLAYGPDITQAGATELATVCYEYSYPDSNSNTSYGKGRREEEEHHYEQPMVRLPSRSPVDSLAKPLISSSSSSSTGGNISPRSAGTLDTTLLPSSPFTRWSTVSAAGARLSLPDSGIALTVPEAALSSPQELGITSIHDTKAFPTLLPGQTLLSPVVCVGTSAGAKHTALLAKPVVLSLPHCASLRQGGWTISVAWRPQGEAAWRSLVTLGQERVDTPLYAQLDLATVHLVTEHLGTFCLLGSPTPGGAAPLKSLRIAAFAQELPQGADLTVRLYCVQDSEAAQAYLEWTERQFGGRLLDRPASCLLQHSGSAAPLALRLDRLGEGWAVQAGAELQQVPFSHLWANNNPALHCSFTLRHTAPHLRTLALSVSIGQEGNAHRCGLKVHTSLATERLLRPSSSGCSSSDSPAAASPWRLPAHTKATLARMLDAPVSLGNDWRMLAERLNVHRYTAFFATKPSPTEALLVLWEARSREAAATQGLLGILRGMGRFDAAHLLEHDLQMA